MVIDESFIVALSFFAFIAVAYRPLSRVIARTLDSRAQRIESELAEAVRLREEAQVMLSNYEKKYREIEQESEQILTHARETADKIRREAEEQLKHDVQTRIQVAHEKVRHAEENAINDVERQVMDTVIETVRDVIRKKYKSQADDQLINVATKDAKRLVH